MEPRFDLSQLRVEELRALSQAIAVEIARRQLAWKYGRGLVERREGIHRNPENPAQTWAGRGPRPDWLTKRADPERD